jgi:peptidoglycan/xylan/chitin deacetylase (PgdA/CDA1 family)
MTNQIFYFHDVLQDTHYNRIQKNELKNRSHFEIFRDAMTPFENAKDIDVVLLIMAEGIDNHPDVVEYIKQHPKWIIGCHGLRHDRYNRKTREEAFADLYVAKKKIEETFGQIVSIFIPPWLRYNGATLNVCQELELEIYSKGFFAIKYMDISKINEYPRIDIHHWHPEDREKVDLYFKQKKVLTNEKA